MSDAIVIPVCDVDDPGSLEAWYGNYSFFDHWRKVVLANCEEIERARFALSGEKVTEGRLETLSRLHPNYLEFLTTHLHGRKLREDMIKSQFVR